MLSQVSRHSHNRRFATGDACQVDPQPTTRYARVMDAPLRPPRPLGQIVVTGRRRVVREALRWSVAGCLVLTGVALAGERHQVCRGWGDCSADDWEPSHSLWSDLGALPFLLVAAALALTLLARKRKMVGSILMAMGTTAVLFGLVVMLAFAHFLSSVRGDTASLVFLLPAMVGAFVQICVEPIVTVRERTLQSRGDPTLASARVVRR